MAKHLCPNTMSDLTNYSAPVPFIGLYIAAATLVCFLLILCDVIHGFRRWKTWFPCRFFALNSITLTLLGIAAKLPVDLTTSMPSAYDQLSKLTGTALICVCMGFLLPSLGFNKPSECVTNMTALTILVVTVVVNISIQMTTGIIFSFIPELIIIMYCMLVVLMYLWLSSWGIKIEKQKYMYSKKDLITNGKGSMLQRLKLCYLHGYDFEPQFVLCKSMHTIFANGHCLLCFVVVLEAIFRSLVSHELEFCNGLSDYGWSMRIIIFTQILVILLASIAIGFRWEAVPSFVAFLIDLVVGCMPSFAGSLVPILNIETVSVITSHTPLLKAKIGDYFRVYLEKAIVIGSIIPAILCLPSVLVFFSIYHFGHRITSLCYDCFVCEDTILDSIQEYMNLLNENGMVLADWLLRKCVKDMNKWTSGSEKINSSSHLGELLSKRPPSQQSLDELNRQYDFKEGKEVSCLDLVFLVRLVSVSTPSALSGHLVGCLSEVFDTIYFVDSTLNSNRWKCKFAKAMWMGKEFSIVLPKASQCDLNHALEIIGKSRNVLPFAVKYGIRIIMDLINGRVYTSIEELYDYMEQLFVDMLHIFLIQLPHAILKELTECSVEEYEETARRMLRFLCQIKHLEDKVQWPFPVGSNITRLITAEASVTNQHITSPMVRNDSSNVVASDVIEDEDHNVRNAHLHEIVQIE